MALSGEEAERSLNEEARKAVAGAVVRENPAFESCATALALAAHPWPDGTVPTPVLEVIASEMSTSRTLPHHDPRELAQDRLLRIAEGLDELLATFSDLSGSYGDLPPLYRRAAGELDNDIRNSPLTGSRIGRDNQQPISLLIGNTTGLRSAAPTPGAVSTAGPTGQDAENAPTIPDTDALGFASALVVGYVRTGHDDLGQLLGGAETGSSALQLVESFQLGPYLSPAHDGFLQTITGRDITILDKRVAFPGERRSGTLSAIGEQFNVTSEAIRRGEQKLLHKVDSLNRNHSGVFDQLAHQVHPSARLVTAAKVLTAGSVNRGLAAKFLLRFEADWETDGDYSIGAQATDRFRSLHDRLAEHADENRLLTNEAVETAVGDLFSSEPVRNTFLEKSGLIQICGFWGLADVQEVHIAAALRTIGRPATKAEIGELAGLTEDQVSSKASDTPNVVRADKTRWGFAEWVDDVYDGIVGEIEQRIDEHGGSVSLSLLIEELRQFGTREASVRTYASTDRFTIENGIVSRNETGYRPRPPHEREGAVRVDRAEDGTADVWGQRVSLEDRHFNGYSLKVGFDLAFANGVRPEDSLLVPVLGYEPCEASVIWRTHDVTRGVDVGRISDLLSEAGFEPGDQLIVVASNHSVRLVEETDIPAAVRESEFEDPVSGEPATDTDAPGAHVQKLTPEKDTPAGSGWDVHRVIIKPEDSDR